MDNLVVLEQTDAQYVIWQLRQWDWDRRYSLMDSSAYVRALDAYTNLGEWLEILGMTPVEAAYDPEGERWLTAKQFLENFMLHRSLPDIRPIDALELGQRWFTPEQWYRGCSG